MTAASETLPASPHREQFWLLLFFSVWCLWNPIDGWRFTPDSGIYIGTAQSMVESGTYWFSGYPNLQYYPGLPILLSLPIRLFGVNFEVLHILCALVGVGAFWLARAYFTPDRYGWTGLAIPFLLGANESLRFQVFLHLVRRALRHHDPRSTPALANRRRKTFAQCSDRVWDCLRLREPRPIPRTLSLWCIRRGSLAPRLP